MFNQGTATLGARWIARPTIAQDRGHLHWLPNRLAALIMRQTGRSPASNTIMRLVSTSLKVTRQGCLDTDCSQAGNKVQLENEKVNTKEKEGNN
jgi:hypothetical protein